LYNSARATHGRDAAPYFHPHIHLHVLSWSFTMKYIRTALYVAVALAAWAQPGYGQTVTTGTLTGLVQDAQGGVMPGVTVTAVHVPTGSSYEAVTQGDGRFALQNVRIGGPYQLTAALAGFRNAVIGEVNVRLGEVTDVPVKLQLATVTENVVVTADVSPVFTGSRAGVTENISEAVIQNLPTINRSFQDIARASPYFNQIASDNLQSALSVAGRNVRYNNLQIDGAVNNDIFSIASGGGSTGTPGGSTETQPISFDVIQELQLVVSPYDVRQGMFSGGGINAVTRSGTNQMRGSAFYVFRDESMVGMGVDNKAISTFNDKQFGGTFGGPILKNKAFFLGNLDWGRKNTPAGYSASGTTGIPFEHTADIQRIQDIATNQYGYNPGGLNEFIRANDNNKVFVRTDFNLGQHQLTVRHNYVNGLGDVGFQDNVTYKLPGNFYRQFSKTNSTVGQLNSRFGKAVNEARLSYQRIRDERAFPEAFPFVRVRLSDGSRVDLGVDSSSQANELDQDIVELHDDYTLIRGKHTYTLGTHNEFFKFRNLFIQNLFGNYEFSSVDKFAAGLSQAYSLGYSQTSDPRQPARFDVYQFSVYAGDQWRVKPNLTLTYGLRFDKPVFPDKPTANQAAVDIYGYRTDIVPSPDSWSPRAGFNWDISGMGTRQQIRGGVGLFSGRNPYVYLSNQYGNTGIEFRRLSQTFNTANNTPFSADPDNQSRTVGAVGTNEIDVIDPNYQFPSIVRGNLAYDRDLPFGLVGNVEYLFSETVRDITYSNLNLAQIGTRIDGRPDYGTSAQRVSTAYSDVILLRNTDQGYSRMITAQLDRRFRGGWFARGAYSFGQSKSVSDTTNSTARSTWLNVYTPGNINDAPLAVSNFDVRHRVVLSGSYAFDFRQAGVTLSMFYNGQTGRPYSYVFGSDLNRDGGPFNDLLYYPRESEVTVGGGSSYQDLVNFIEGGECSDLAVGTIIPRNVCRLPFVHNLDFRAAVNVPVGRFKPEFTVDVLNLLNLFDRTQGQVLYTSFNDIPAVNVTESGGKYAYTLNAVAKPAAFRFSRDDLRSRWQAQIGLRLRF
jgi:hypothetical protein